MKQNRSGWKGESRRHSLARKGVKTTSMKSMGRVVTKEYEVFKFDELPDDIKDKVLENYWDINVDFEWYDLELDYQADKLLEEIGVNVSPNKIYFSLDRGYYIYLDDATIEDKKKFLKFLGVDLRTSYAKEILNEEQWIWIDKEHYGGGRAENVIKTGSGGFIEREWSDTFNSRLDDIRILLEQTYYDLVSEETVIETLKANEYEFTKDGKIFG